MNEPTGQADADWPAFHRLAAKRPARELLRRTLACCWRDGRDGGVAVDLGAGSGVDTLELLGRDWTVHAVDIETAALHRLAARLAPETRLRLHCHTARFESYALPRCDLVWASWSLPYCVAAEWPGLMRRIHDALTPGGRFAGDVFGDRHGWADDAAVLTLPEDDLRRQLAALYEVEVFDVEDGLRITGDGRTTPFHAYGVVCRKRG